jgi:hypothetical protein
MILLHYDLQIIGYHKEIYLLINKQAVVTLLQPKPLPTKHVDTLPRDHQPVRHH